MLIRLIILIFLANISYAQKVDITVARDVYFKNDPFKEVLRAGYVKFHDYAVKYGDKQKAYVYGRKALATTKNIIPEIEGVSGRNIPLSRLNSLLGSKYFLESAFINGTTKTAPEVSAQAQLMFDCWVDQEEERVKKERTIVYGSICRDEFIKLENGLRIELDKIKESYRTPSIDLASEKKN